MPLSFRKTVFEISPYVPGKPIEDVKRELGLDNVIKLASNENPFGCSMMAKQAIIDSALDPQLYPDGNCTDLKNKLSGLLGVETNQLLFGAGSDEIISLIARIYINPGDESIVCSPSFTQYDTAVRVMDGVMIKIPLKNYRFDVGAMAAAITDRTKIIWICNPNNPTGTIITKDEQDYLIEKTPENVLVVIDEAYHEYVTNNNYPDSLGLLSKHPNVVILRTFSKIYGLASLRIGYAIADKSVIDFLNRVRGPFNVTTVAQKAASASLDDNEFRDTSRIGAVEGKKYLYGEFQSMGLEYIASEANFVMVNTGIDSTEAFKRLLSLGIIVRSGNIFGMDTWLRVTVGSQQDNELFINGLKKILV